MASPLIYAEEEWEVRFIIKGVRARNSPEDGRQDGLFRDVER